MTRMSIRDALPRSSVARSLPFANVDVERPIRLGRVAADLERSRPPRPRLRRSRESTIVLAAGALEDRGRRRPVDLHRALHDAVVPGRVLARRAAAAWVPSAIPLPVKRDAAQRARHGDWARVVAARRASRRDRCPPTSIRAALMPLLSEASMSVTESVGCRQPPREERSRRRRASGRACRPRASRPRPGRSMNANGPSAAVVRVAPQRDAVSPPQKTPILKRPRVDRRARPARRC